MLSVLTRARISPNPRSHSSQWTALWTTPVASPVASARLLEIAWYFTALLIVLVTGLTGLEVPLHGDPALFLSYARWLDEGSRLYVDLWDVKPPAVYAFYYLGGSLFGFTDRGIHLFELSWMLVLAGSMIVGLRPLLQQRWLAAVAPVAAIGSYYALTSPGEKTQVESLVNLPIFLSVLALTGSARSPAKRPWYALLAGAAAAAVTVFKVVFAPIFMALVLVATAEVLRLEGKGIRAITGVAKRLWLPFAAGVALVWVAVVVVFAGFGTADAMLWTVFRFPLEALAGVEYAPLKRMIVALRMFLGDFAPWLIFVAVALSLLWRRDSSLLVKLLWAWLIVGALVILLQRTSWWYYHFMLLIAPVGCLAAVGVDRVVTFVRSRAHLSPVMTMVMSCMLVVPAVGSFADPVGSMANLLFPSVLGTKPIDSFKETFENYPDVSAAASFVRNQPKPGPIMVFETPLTNLLSDRRQATPVPGFIWGWILPRHYQETTEELYASPPPFIFVGTNYKERVHRYSPGIIDLLKRSYRVAWESPFGRWYALRNVGDDERIPGGSF